MSHRSINLKDKIAVETEEEMRARQAIALRDPQRPRYHYQPEPSWMNDPFPFFWKGEYHVFHQHSPEGKPYHHEMSWAHIVSKDLVHWKTLPTALSPSPGGPDKRTWDRYISENLHGGPFKSLYELLNKKEYLHLSKRGDDDLAPTPPSPDTYGCWSGCVIEHHGLFYIFYTGHASGGQCVATSKDLITWEKTKDNRVIKQWRTVGDRDPCVWEENGKWYMILTGLDMYESSDLFHWRYLHKLGDECECDEVPEFFPLWHKHVLLTNHYPKAPDPRGAVTSFGESPVGTCEWDVGRYANQRFTSQNHGLIDWGNFYSAKTLRDDRGRRIMWGWILEGRPIEEQIKAGWSGVLSLPRLLTMLPGNTLGMEPVPELEALRGKHWRYENVRFDCPGGTGLQVLKGVEGDGLEILASFSPRQKAERFGIVVQGSDEIIFDRREQRLAGAPFSLADAEPLTLRVYVDRSIIEVFANRRFCKTIRSYHKPGDNQNVSLLVSHGTLKLDSGDAWEIDSAVWSALSREE